MQVKPGMSIAIDELSFVLRIMNLSSCLITTNDPSEYQTNSEKPPETTSPLKICKSEPSNLQEART